MPLHWSQWFGLSFLANAAKSSQSTTIDRLSNSYLTFEWHAASAAGASQSPARTSVPCISVRPCGAVARAFRRFSGLG
jgi:hypothetical protein